MKDLYDSEFYIEQSPGSIKSAKKIVPFLLQIMPNINSVVDIGCGVGGWLNEWKQNGKTILGMDGNKLSEKEKKILDSEYLLQNLETPLPVPKQKYSLCMSLEVAEHLPFKRAASFVRDLCLYSNAILFSSAIPGQTGVNHINEQWPQFWADLFINNNYNVYDCFREQFWNDDDVAWWYAQNMFLYVKKGSSLERVFEKKVVKKQNVICAYVHPKCLALYTNNYNNLVSQKKPFINGIKSVVKKIIFFIKHSMLKMKKKIL